MLADLESGSASARTLLSLNQRQEETTTRFRATLNGDGDCGAAGQLPGIGDGVSEGILSLFSICIKRKRHFGHFFG